LKMEIGRNVSMSGINSCHHNLPTYEISLKSNNVEFVRIVVANLKMAWIDYDVPNLFLTLKNF
jgi:hypothetical protein